MLGSSSSAPICHLPRKGTRLQAPPALGSLSSSSPSTRSVKLAELSSAAQAFAPHSPSPPLPPAPRSPVSRSRSRRLLEQRQPLPSVRRARGSVSASASASVATEVTEAPPEVSAMDAAEKAQSVVQHMRKVFRTGATKDIKWRQTQLLALAKMIKEREAEFYEAIKQDLGRGPSDSYAELLAPMISAEDAARKVAKWAKPSKVGTDTINLPGSSEVVPEPFGVVLIIGPWNFPFTCLLEPLVGALAAGNAVVIKPSEISPASSALLARLVPQYLDSSAIQVVEGGPDMAVALLEHRWDSIFFTGGTEIGRKIAVAAAKHLTPVTLELGGKNPCYVDSTCDFALACRRIVWGAFLNAGQICLKAEYVLVEESFAGKLIEGLKKTILEFYGENPKESPDIARIVSDRHMERLTGLLADSRTAECIVHGGQSDKSTRFIAPTILRDVPWDCPVMQQETFGPILAVQTVNSLEEAIAIINDRPKPLALYAFTSAQDAVQKLIAETSSGAFVTNEVVTHILNPHLPFGGVGASGLGSYHGKYSFDCFSHHKAVLKKGSLGDVPFRYPPSNAYKNSLMRALFSYDFVSLILILVGLKK